MRKLRKFFVDQKWFIVIALAVVAAFLVERSSYYPWQEQLSSWWNVLWAYAYHDGKLDVAFLGKVFLGIATTCAGIFALWRWTVDQHWRRVQFAYGLTEKFFAKENTKLALRMLDATGEMNLPAGDDELRVVHISEKLLVNSLLTLQQQRTFAEPEFSIRMIFDEFFTDLSAFQHHIEAGLVKLDDIHPYLKYWIGSINGHGSIYSITLARQINAFLTAFGYSAVLELSKSMKLGLRNVRVDPIGNDGDDADLADYYQRERQGWKHELNTESTAPRVTIGFEVVSRIADYLSIVRTDTAYARNDSRKNMDFKTVLWNSSKKDHHASILDFFDAEEKKRTELQDLLQQHIVESLEGERRDRGFKERKMAKKAVLAEQLIVAWLKERRGTERRGWRRRGS